jgi:Membrane bound beta barrel domain (DUF5777)
MTEECRMQNVEWRSSRRRTFLCILHSAFCILLFANAAFAQTNQYTPITPIPLGDTYLTLPSSHIAGHGSWEMKFTHRFAQSLDQGSLSDRLHSLWGLDSNADVGLGLSYTIRPDLQVSFLRSNALDDIELGAKYIVIQQAQAVPFTLALRGGADIRTEAGLDERTSLFAQAIVSRQFGKRAEIFAIPTFVTDAGRAVVGTKSTALFEHAFNVPVGFAWVVTDALSVVGELIPKNRDLPRDLNADFAWAVGLKRAVGGHYFEILVTNSNATHADQYVSSTYMGSPLDKSDVHLGFNIERRFGK